MPRKTPLMPGAPTPTPVFAVTNVNVVVNEGGSAEGLTVTFVKGRRKGQTIKRGTGGGFIQTHHPIFVNAKGVEYINRGNRFIPLATSGLNVVRRETVKRG